MFWKIPYQSLHDKTDKTFYVLESLAQGLDTTGRQDLS